MKKAIAYVRVSTELQASEGVSLEAQKAKIAAWCELNDCELAAVYVDAGISGKRADNRPELQKALDHVCDEAGVLIVYSLSRLARSTKDTLSIGDRLAKSKADLVSLSEKIDTTTAAGKMVFRMLAVLAEFERDQLSERVTMAMNHKRTKNERISGRLPYGYTLSDDGITLVTVTDENNVLSVIKELRSDGLSLRKIADELNTRGIVAKHGRPWKHSTIASLVKRPQVA
jgi:DNA invertase Pin-like site-specific DNA recombinase